MGNAYWKLPITHIVSALEHAESLSAAAHKSIKKLAKTMREMESTAHRKLATRLSALV
jgi:hypothetical protein